MRLSVAIALTIAACGGLAERDGFNQAAGGSGGLSHDGGLDAGFELDGTAGSAGKPDDAWADAAICDIPDEPGYLGCCNGVLCRGQCNDTGCHCGLIVGGCWEGSVCCGSNCGAPDFCPF